MSEPIIKGWHVRLSFSPSPGYYTQFWNDVLYEIEVATSEGEDMDVVQVEEIIQPASWWENLETNTNEFTGW